MALVRVGFRLVLNVIQIDHTHSPRPSSILHITYDSSMNRKRDYIERMATNKIRTHESDILYKSEKMHVKWTATT